jgi:hypothetical protein
VVVLLIGVGKGFQDRKSLHDIFSRSTCDRSDRNREYTDRHSITYKNESAAEIPRCSSELVKVSVSPFLSPKADQHNLNMADNKVNDGIGLNGASVKYDAGLVRNDAVRLERVTYTLSYTFTRF